MRVFADSRLLFKFLPFTKKAIVAPVVLAVIAVTTAYSIGISPGSIGSFILSSLGGGSSQSPLTGISAERANASETPATNSTSPSTLSAARSGHTATLLNDGRVLVVGGRDDTSAEIFDPVANLWVATGSTNAVRTGHTATRLADGRVLIAGGSSNSTEIYDPASATFSPGPSMNSPRTGHTATTIGGGNILIAGGGSDSAEIFDGATFNAVANAMTVSRANASAAALADGRVFIAGGDGLTSAEIFDPANGSFSAAGNAMTVARARALLRLLPDGKMQIIGGGADGSMEVYDPSIDTIGAYAHVVPESDPCANLINYVLAAETRAALVFNGSTAPERDRRGHTITELGASAIVIGGTDSTGNALASTVVYNSSNATVTTDKLDYSPGQTATISGTGFAPGETVRVMIHEDPHTPQERGFDAVADANGNFTGTYAVTDYDAAMKFIAGARGLTSRATAQTTFTDGNIKVSSNAAGVTYDLPWTVHSGPACAGSALSSGTENNIGFSGGAIWTKGVGNTESIKLIAPAFSDQGGTFNGWTSSHPFNPPYSSPSATVCIDGNFTGGTHDFVANYSTELATNLSLAAPSPASVVYGSAGPVTLSATLRRTVNNSAVSGATITFTVDGTNVGTAVTNASGVATLATYNPSALAIGGHSVQATFAQQTISSIVYAASTSGTQTLTINQAGTTTTITSDHLTAGTAWTQISPSGTGPSLTTCGQSAVPDGNGRLIVYARTVCGGGIGQVWVLNGANGVGSPSWSLVTSGGPSRHAQTVTYDKVNNRLMLFGGCSGGCLPANNDVWVLTNANGQGGVAAWTNLATSGAPPAARNHATGAYDPATNRMIIFGGQNGGGFVDNASTFGDVWVLSNANGIGGTPVWSQVSPETAPGTPLGQYQSRAFYDSTNNRLTVAGGVRPSVGGNSNAVHVLTNANGLGGAPIWTNLIPEGAIGAPAFAGWNVDYDTGANRGILAVQSTSNVYYLNNANGLGGPTTYTLVSPAGGGGAVPGYGLGFDTTTGRTMAWHQGGGTNRSYYLSPASSSVYGESVTFTANVTVNAPGSGTPTGSVQFYAGATPIGSPQPISGGAASIVTSSLIVGTHNMTAQYLGDANFTVSTSGILPHAVTQAPTTTTLASSQNPSNQGQSVTFTSTTLSGGNPVTEGSVTFIEGGTCASPATILQAASAVSGGGQAVFTTNALAPGSHTITACYSATNYAVSEAAVSQTVHAAPSCANDSGATNEDVTLNDTVVCIDPTNDPLTYSKLSDPANGVLTFNSDGTFTYQPNADFFGSDSFTFKADDTFANSNVATYSITVNAVNDAPSFVTGSDQTVNEDAGAQTVNPWATAISAGPANESGQAVSFIITGNTNPTLFSAGPSVSPAGVLTYTPAADAFGFADITLAIKDNGGTANGGVDTSAPQTFRITVNAVNDPPVAVDDAALTNEDTPIAFTQADLKGNDADIDNTNAQLSVTAVSNPTNGTVVLNGDGTVMFSPAPDFFGTAGFDYTVSDGSLTDIGHVTITVNAVNDAPVCASDAGTTDEDTPLNDSVSCSDIDGPSLTYSVVAGPANGSLASFNTVTGAFTYSPNLNFNGADSFTFKASDSTLDSNIATYSITVTAVNDAPIGVDDSYTTSQENLLIERAPGVLGNDTDVDSSGLTAVLDSSTTNGVLSLNADGSFTYLPNAGFTGTDTFTYHTTDGALSSNGATVTISVVAPSCSMRPTDMVAWLTGNNTANDVIGNNNGTLMGGAAYDVGKVNLSFKLDGVDDYVDMGNGTDLHVSSGDFTVDAWVKFDSLTHPPGANTGGAPAGDMSIVDKMDNTAQPNEDGWRLIKQDDNHFYFCFGAAGNGCDLNVPTTVRSTTTASVGIWYHIAAVKSATEIAIYVNGFKEHSLPAPAFIDTNTADMRIGSNIREGAHLNGRIDEVEIFDRALGTSEIKSIFDASFLGKCNSVPTTMDDAYATDEDVPLNVPAPGVLGNDTDANGDTMTAVLTDGPDQAASFSLHPDGSFSYTPNLNFNGTDTFKYTATDDIGVSSEATVTITVNAVNDAPDAVDNSATTAEDTPYTFSAAGTGSLKDNDTDVDNSNSQLFVNQVSDPPNGTAVVNGDNSVTYTPDADFNGPDSFTYTLCDPGQDASAATATDNLCDTATVNMTVTEVNDAPIADTDGKTTAEDTPLTFPAADLTANDLAGPANESGQTLTVSSVTAIASTHGTVALISGSITYTPDADYNGPASFNYQVCDNGTTNGTADPLCATGTVNVTVTEVNDAPTAQNDNKTTAEDTGLNFPSTDLTTNDTAGPANENSQTLTVTAVGTASHGTVVLNADGSITYTPTGDYYGPDSFNYTVTDNGTTNGAADHKSAAATVNITVTEVNDSPTANVDSKSTNEDTPLGFASSDLTANDSKGPANESGQTLTVTSVTGNASTHGAVSLSSGTVTYTPDLNYNGPASFDYEVCDDGTTNGSADHKCAAGTVNVTVNPVNDVPTANDGSATTNEDSAGVAIDLGASVADVETADANMTYDIVSGPANGSLTGGGTQTPMYTPNADYYGPDSFTYKVTDRGDPDNCGTPSVSCSAAATSATKTVSITVTEINDPPTAAADNKTTAEDTGLNFPSTDLTANDSAGPGNEGAQTLTVTAVSATSTNGGTVAVAGGQVTYTPAADFNGSDSFTYNVCDNGTTGGTPDPECAVGTVNVTVTEVNDAPSAVGDSASTNEDTAVILSNATLTANDSKGPANESGQTLTITAVGPASHGTAALNGDGSVTYSPAANYNGPDSFTYTITDNGTTNGSPAPLSSTATVDVTVSPVNDAPTAGDGTASTNEDTASAPIDLTALVGDQETADSDLSYVIDAGPTNGSLSGSASNPVYTPNANFNGADSFTYHVVDRGDPDNCGAPSLSCAAAMSSETKTITVTVNAVNDAPSFTEGADQTVNEDAGPQTVASWAIGISSGPSNESSQTASFTVTANTNPALFSAAPSVAPDGTLTYTPAANANGSASVTIVLQDDGGTANGGVDTSTPRTFAINVTPVNDTPTANPQSVTTDEDTSVAITLTGDDGDPELSQTLTYTIATGPSHGTLTGFNAATGAVTYNPAPDYNGPDSFTFTATDDATAGGPALSSAPATVSLTVTAVNDKPMITSMAMAPGTINENGSSTLNASFTDIDSSTFTLSINWGDGSPAQPVGCPSAQCVISGGVWNVSVPHQYFDDDADDTYTVHLTVNDNGSPNLTDVRTTNVTVNNVAPVITSVTGPVGPLPLGTGGTNTTITANFTDVGSLDPHTCTFVWDDGTPNTTVSAAGTGNGSCSASHTYSTTGVYTVQVTVADDDGGSTITTFQYVVIFDPNGGFVTGGGWIMSPAGACRLDPSCFTATGRANFGFVSKYKRGSNVPEGQTEFQFQAGNINFHSSSYDFGSLVISSYKAQYKGVGTINGQPGYKFVLTAYDGQINGGGNDGNDKFRIKISRVSDGAVVYDNQMGASDDIDTANPTIISGGSINIQKAK